MALVVAAESAIDRARPGLSQQALFRHEIMEVRQSQWLGTVLLEPRVSHRVFAGLAVATALALIALLILGTYTRKERANGWLVPRAGVARVVAPQNGVITELKVSDGQAVQAGAPLLVISGELQSQSGPVREEVVSRLRQRRDSLTAQRSEQEKSYRQQIADLRARIEASQSQLSHIDQEITLQRDRIDLSERRLNRLRPLRERGITTVTQVESAEQDRIDQAAQMQALQREKAQLERDFAELTGTLNQLPYQEFTIIAENDRNVAAVEQELSEAEALREIVVTAPQSGTITNLQATVGSSVRNDLLLLSIVPAGSTLRAELFSTSLSIGFIHPGQKVRLRYDAFPYQKFGLYEGTVASVSRAAMSPSDLPKELTNLSTMYPADKPIYKLTVDLASQSAQGYGKALPLQVGMQLSGDVMIDRRTLLQWILDPIYALTGSW